MKIRELVRDEIDMLGQIDRSEIIENLYYLRQGTLVLEAEYYDMRGWPPGEPESLTPGFLECFDRGCYFWGAFDENKLIDEELFALEPEDIHLELSLDKVGEAST